MDRASSEAPTHICARPFAEWDRARSGKRVGAGHRLVTLSTLPHSGMELLRVRILNSMPVLQVIMKVYLAR